MEWQGKIGPQKYLYFLTEVFLLARRRISQGKPCKVLPKKDWVLNFYLLGSSAFEALRSRSKVVGTAVWAIPISLLHGH